MLNLKKRGIALVSLVSIILFFLAFSIGVEAGNVDYVWNLTNDSQVADYLIIAHESFYNDIDLYSLAQYRADSNGFGVAIANLSDITNQFNDTAADPTNETAIKNFIAYVYENWSKNVRVNNDIFVLLVGDVAAEGEIDYMPSHISDLTGPTGNLYLTDNWYADVNNSDRKQDVYIGRFSVKDNVNLSIIANKTIKYENETTLINQEWLKKMFFINPDDDSDVASAYSNIKTSYTDKFDFSYIDMSPAISNDITENISYGRFITSYVGSGLITKWAWDGLEWGCSQVPSLTNNDNLTIVFSFACAVAEFNYTSESLGECMTQAEDKGAVAFFGGTDSVGATTAQNYAKRVFEAIFANNSATLGEAIKISKDWLVDVGGPNEAELYNLLGDPALGIKDYKSPGFSEINVSDLTNRQATVTWTTDEASNSTVFYGTTEEASSVSGIDDSITLHTVTLTGLVKNTLYYYNVSSCDANGNCNNSWQGSFTTLSNGTINYYWNLSDTSNSADWLVIAHENFYDNADLLRLAQYRAEANSFDVGIVNLSDITQQFNDTAVDPANDTAVKNFINYTYENWTKNVRTNNDIFVLLVGDIKDDVDPEYMPSHLSDLAGDGYTDLTDNWYADVNGSDYKPDVYIGRFAVKDNVNLSIIANKTVKYENETNLVNQEWLKRINFINALDETDTNDTYNTIKTSYTDQFGFTYGDILPGFGFGGTTDDITNNISDGVWITNYEGGGDRNNWIYSGGNGFGCANVPSLTNGDNLTIVFSFASATGHFNNTNGAVTFTECMALADNKGAVAFLGASGEPGMTSDLALNSKIFQAIFENNSATLGEAIKLGKDWRVDVGGINGAKDAEVYNLLGDPALQIKDYKSPGFSEINVSDLTNRQATVMWTTDEASNSSVHYGTNEGTLSVSGIDDSITLHTVTITGLVKNTLYYYNVSSCDTNGNCNNSWQGSFTTLSNGTINYYWNLSDTSNSADWLVIAHENFYDNADLLRLAQYRAEANSFDVGIVNLSDITQQFNDTAVDPSNDTAIKNFTAYVYENWTKNVRTNNDIFVLLVGDALDGVDPDYIPAHPSPSLIGGGTDPPTDNWYADTNGSDDKPDVYIGRFAVKDNVNLSIIANKTLKYENETTPTQDWLKKMIFVNSFDSTDPDVNDTTYADIKSSYTDQFGFSYEDMFMDLGSTTDDFTNNVSYGAFITAWWGEGTAQYFSYAAGNSWGCSQVPSLQNSNNLTILLSFTAGVGLFNSSSGESLAECLTQVNDTGAVAVFAAAYSAGATRGSVFKKKVFEAIFANNSATLGEALKLAKDWMADTGYLDDVYRYNLLGDPALKIKDYTDPNISLDSPSDNTVDNDGVVSFNFTVTESSLDTCELYGNWSGGWHANQSFNGFTQSLTQNFSDITLPDGNYYWNVYCNDTNGNSNFSALNYSLTVDSTYPSISLSTPTNGSSWTSSQTVSFTYTVSDWGVSNCSLIVNDAVNSTTTGSQSFSITLLNGAYNWSVNCTDNANLENSSDIYDLTVSYSPGSESPGGGTSGGGGGGGGAGTASAFDVDFSIQRTSTLRTAENVISTLSFDGVTSHTIKVDKVTGDSATITVSSEPVTVTVKLGETATVDLNKDSIMDMEITLDSVMGKATDIVVSKLTGADIIAQEDTAASKQKFSLNKKEIRTEVVQGETVTETFRIKNDGIGSLLLNLKVSDDLKGYVILSKDSITINKGGEENIDVNFLAPATLEPKLYSGKIIVGTDLKQLSLPIQMTVKKREALFDVKVKIPEKFKTVYPGESVVADITLLNIGKIGQVDVDVYYAIKNQEGTVITFSKETVGVEVATSFTKTLTLPEDVTKGNYTYFVKITYKDASTTGEDYFMVKSKISYIPTIIQKRLVEILVWVFGTALLFTIYFLARSKFKEKYLEKGEKELEERVSKIEKTRMLPSFGELFYKQSLTKFCKEKLEQGYTEKQIIQAAKASGWEEEQIIEMLEGLKK